MIDIATAWRKVQGRPDRRWRLAGVVAASLVLHLALLGPIVWGRLGLNLALAPASPDIVAIPIEMEPRPLLPGERARVVRPSPQTSVVTPTTTAADTAVSRFPQRLPDDEDDDQPTTPNPRATTASPQGVPVPAGPIWRVAPPGLGERIGDSLRAGIPGCRAEATLTASERERCDERFANAARSAPPITGSGDDRRDGRFARAGAQALALYDARRAPLSGAAGVVGASPECVGGNLRGTCAGAHLRDSFQQPENAPFRDRAGAQ